MWRTGMKYSGVLIITALACLGVYDFCVVYFTGHMSSISETMYNFGIRSPLGVFIAGVCIGHFWLAVYPEGYEPKEPK